MLMKHLCLSIGQATPVVAAWWISIVYGTALEWNPCEQTSCLWRADIAFKTSTTRAKLV